MNEKLVYGLILLTGELLGYGDGLGRVINNEVVENILGGLVDLHIP